MFKTYPKIIFILSCLIFLKCICFLGCDINTEEEYWSKVLGFGSKDTAKSVAPLGENGSLIAGDTQSFPTDDFWLLRLNAFGDVVWQKTYDSGFNDTLYTLQETENNTFIAAGAAFVRLLEAF